MNGKAHESGKAETQRAPLSQPMLKLIHTVQSSASGTDDENLNAWLDGLMDPRRAASFEGTLSRRPDAAAKAMAYRAQISGLQALYNPVLDEPIPERLLEALRQNHGQKEANGRHVPLWPAVTAAGMAAVFLGTVLLSSGLSLLPGW